MRDFLTGLAIILIVVLTTVLVAPYFVDWTSQRGFLETRLSHALGQKVTIGGAIDLKLLPTPYLVLDQVVVGGDDGPLRIGIHHLDLELTVAPLLHGEFDIVEARLEQPTIRLSLQRDRTLPALPTAPAFQADVRFDRIQVSDGTLAIADPESGHTFVLDHLDLDADAGSFTGPFKVSGAEGPADQRTKFRLATAAPENGRTRARLVVEETPSHVGLELEGLLKLTAADNESLRQSFEGTLAASGHLAKGSDPAVAWKLSGPLVTDPASAVVDGGELRLGSDEAGVTLKANAKAEFGDRPKLALDFSAKQLDFDRLSGAPVDAVKPPPPKLPGLAVLESMIADLRPSLETGVDITVDNATYGGETLSDLHANFGIGGAVDQPFQISADGPGGTHIAIDGRLVMGANPSFAGHVDLDADNLPRAVDWLGSVSPSLPWTGAGMPFQTVKLGGFVKASRAAVDADAIAITLDRSVFKGSARFDLAAGEKGAKLTANLRSDALDLDGLPSLDTMRGSSGLIDLELRLDAKAIKVSQVGDGALDAGHIRLALTKTGRRIDLKDFRADDLGGATIGGTGTIDAERGSLKATIDATHLDAAAALVRQLAPGRVADALVNRAAVLAPARLTIDAVLAAKPDGALAPSSVSVTGTLGATRVDAIADPDAARGETTSISALLTAPDGGVLLAQLGVPALPMAVIGASRVRLSALGQAGQPLDAKVTANLGATAFDLHGRFDMFSATPSGTGSLRLRSPDATPLLQTLAIAFPDMAGRIPADIGCDLALGTDGFTCQALKGQVAGIGTGGTLRYQTAAGDQPALTGSLDLDRLTLSGLVGLALGPEQPPAPNASWSKEPFAVGLIDPPHSAVTVNAKALELVSGVVATNASFELGIAQNLVTIGKVQADLSGGRVKGGVTLRRDGHQATLEGQLSLNRVEVHLATLKTDLSAKVDFAGGGASSLSLVASLAGSGEATTSGLEIPGGDPAALPKIFADVENDALAVDQDAIIHALEDAAKGPLSAGNRHFRLSLAAGVVHFDPKDPPAADGPVSSKVDASYDLTRSSIEAHVEQTLETLPKNWTGPPPQIVMTLAGPSGRPVRSFDVSNFLNAVAARALARETARIEAYEFDIRERAIFNTRLQSERRREEERVKAEDDARRAEAEREARAEAARLERLRQEQAEKAAKDKAAKEKAAKDQAMRDAADKAEREAAGKAAREREPVNPDRGPPSASPPQAPEPQQAPEPSAPPVTDPSTLGRY